MLVSANGGITFYQGNNPLASGVFANPEGFTGAIATLREESRRIAQAETGGALGDAEVSGFWFRKGLAYLAGDPLHAAALAGVGVVLSTRLLVEDAVRSGALVPVLPEWTGPAIEVRLVFPGRSGLFPRSRAFIDLLVSRAVPLMARAEEMAGQEGSPADRPRRKA